MGLWLTINLEQFDNIGQSAGEAGIRVSKLEDCIATRRLYRTF